jgi:hypothetical protein
MAEDLTLMAVAVVVKLTMVVEVTVVVKRGVVEVKWW